MTRLRAFKKGFFFKYENYRQVCRTKKETVYTFWTRDKNMHHRKNQCSKEILCECRCKHFICYFSTSFHHFDGFLSSALWLFSTTWSVYLNTYNYWFILYTLNKTKEWSWQIHCSLSQLDHPVENVESSRWHTSIVYIYCMKLIHSKKVLYRT